MEATEGLGGPDKLITRSIDFIVNYIVLGKHIFNKKFYRSVFLVGITR